MVKLKKCLIVLVLTLVPFCLGAAGLKEAYNCGQAAQLLQINADAYRTPAPTAEEILGGLSPYAPLTHMEGCEMILRAFGPLPDAEEGVRYLIKYRDCAFTDVPQEGKEAVDNLVNAGLYIPKDNTVFGPNQLMTEEELAVLIDRIHAYLQSSPKDDFYSWATAEVLNNPIFLDVPYDVVTFKDNIFDSNKRQVWMLNVLNDCLKNPDTPEKRNIAAVLSTYMDQEEREKSMTNIQPLVDAIWNAPDYESLINVCADIHFQTGVEALFTETTWSDFTNNVLYYDSEGHRMEAFGLDYLDDNVDAAYYLPGHFGYEAFMEQKTKLFSYLGIDMEAATIAFKKYQSAFIWDGLALYKNSDIPKKYAEIFFDDIPKELEIFPWVDYLKRAGYENDKSFFVSNLAEMAIILSLWSDPENLSAIKVHAIINLIGALKSAVPARIRDASLGFWGEVYAANPSYIFAEDDLRRFLFSLIQTDVYEYYSKLEEFNVWNEYLTNLCNLIITHYKDMLSETTWLSPETKTRALEKLDAMKFELLIPEDCSNQFKVEYISAEDGGTHFENLTRYLKERPKWMYHSNNLPHSEASWSINNCWNMSPYYNHFANTFFLTVSNYVASHITFQSPVEEVLGHVGQIIGHEISHAFDYGRSYINKDGEYEDWWTENDRRIFLERTEKLASFMEGYEYFPGFRVINGNQVVDETIADLTSMKCLMRIASQYPDFNYEALFKAYARTYAISATRRGSYDYLVGDEHPIGRLRLNKILSLTDQFYKTYDIQPGDAMYVAPQDRLSVW